MRISTNNRVGLLAALLALALSACSDSSDGPKGPVEIPLPPPPPVFEPIAQASVSEPPEAGSPALLATTFDLGLLGYRQEEYFLTGEARVFRNLSPLTENGEWDVEAGATADYRTRIIIYRPQDPADFSGTVLVEWLNVTAGFDTAPSYATGHVEILRQGHVWVGVSAQQVGIEGSANAVAPLHLKAANPERYESLQHPGDSFSYDIFSQALQALREPGNRNLLPDLEPQQILALGESQSAGRLVTYINAIHPVYRPFDGYLVHSRGDGSPPLSQPPQIEIPTPERVLIRDDLDVPVLNFQTETDLFLLGAVSDRQADSERFRLWEVAGTAHGDYYSFIIGRADTGEDPRFLLVEEATGIPGFLQCDRPVNAGPMAWVFGAAVRALDTWVRDGTLPPAAERLQVDDSQSAFERDSLGIARGGIRTPWVDAPAATLSGEGQSGDRLCFLFGTTELFDADHMASLYVDQAGYVAAVEQALEAAIAKGFLLPEDAARIRAVAPLQWQSQVP